MTWNDVVERSFSRGWASDILEMLKFTGILRRCLLSWQEHVIVQLHLKRWARSTMGALIYNIRAWHYAALSSRQPLSHRNCVVLMYILRRTERTLLSNAVHTWHCYKFCRALAALLESRTTHRLVARMIRLSFHAWKAISKTKAQAVGMGRRIVEKIQRRGRRVSETALTRWRIECKTTRLHRKAILHTVQRWRQCRSRLMITRWKHDIS